MGVAGIRRPPKSTTIQMSNGHIKIHKLALKVSSALTKQLGTDGSSHEHLILCIPCTTELAGTDRLNRDDGLREIVVHPPMCCLKVLRPAFTVLPQDGHGLPAQIPLDKLTNKQPLYVLDNASSTDRRAYEACILHPQLLVNTAHLILP